MTSERDPDPAPPTAEPITSAPFLAGISNQKLAIAGLVVAARREERAITLPPLVQFAPDMARPPVCRFEDIFDIEAFAGAAGLAISGTSTDARDPTALFHETMASIGAAQQAGILAGSEIAKLAGAFHPAPHLREVIDEAASQFRARGGHVVCQMRVEPDWQHYMNMRLAPRIGGEQDLTTDPIEIARKIRETLGPEIGPVLITCDLVSLPVPPSDLSEAIGAQTGLEVIFKSDLIDKDQLPKDPLGASLVDFELMAAADVMIGTTLSSFFGLAALTQFARNGVVAEAWAYNAPGGNLVLRTDNGAFANLARATRPLPADALNRRRPNRGL